MFAPLTQALSCVMLEGVWDKIESYDGCYNHRNKRGRRDLSEHAYGTAIDINASTNQMGDTPSIHPTIVACFEDAGFEWGGRWQVPDGMHFELPRHSFTNPPTYGR